MADPSRRFFDLDVAAEASRRLLRPEPIAPPPATAPAAPAATATPRSPRPFSRPVVEYRLELWDAMLEWAREVVGADGCFALDERGFLVASSGDLGQVPPEVFLSAFTATDDTINTYTDTEYRLRRAIYELKAGAQVTLLPVRLTDDQVLVGLLGGAVPDGPQSEIIQATIVDEIAAFDAGTQRAS